MIEASIKSSDLLYLSVSIFEVANPKAVVVIIPGLKEYKNRYYKLIEYLNSLSFSAYVYDPRGQGKSVNDANPLGYISSSNDLVGDVGIIINYVKSREGDAPIYVIGDSLGALSLINLLPNNNYISKVVLTSPLVSSAPDASMKQVNMFMKFLGKTKSSDMISSYIGLNNQTVLINDPNGLHTIKNDNLLNYKLKNISVYRILELQSNMKKLKFNNNFKLFIGYGILDKTICTESRIKDLSNIFIKCGINTTVQKYNAGHKILFDSGNILVWQDIVTFFLSNE